METEKVETENEETKATLLVRRDLHRAVKTRAAELGLTIEIVVEKILTDALEDRPPARPRDQATSGSAVTAAVITRG